MAMIQAKSAERAAARETFERLDEARAAALAARLAGIMGLCERDPGSPIEPATLEAIGAAAARSGIGETAVAAPRHGRRRRRPAAALLEALEASPLPEAEIRSTAATIGWERLAELSGASLPSLRRYAAGTRGTPDPVAHRVHFLARILATLAGSYNEFGARRWLERPRTALGGRAPASLLRGDWDPDDDGPRQVRELAEALLA
jgi:uncharacterized protein (DUF2384 family)